MLCQAPQVFTSYQLILLEEVDNLTCQLTANEPMNVPIPSQQPGPPQMAPQPPIPQQGPQNYKYQGVPKLLIGKHQ